MGARARNQLYVVLSIVFAIGAIFSTCYLPLCMVNGSFAVLFAELSKGTALNMKLSSIISTVIGWGAMTVSILLTVLVVYLVLFDPYGKEYYRDMLNDTFTQSYGITFEEYLDQWESSTGIDIDY